MATRSVRDRRYWQPWWGITIALGQDGDSLKELAERIGMDQSKLGRLARGDQKPDSDDLLKISIGQGRPLSWYNFGPERDPELAGYIPGSLRSSFPRRLTGLRSRGYPNSAPHQVLIAAS